MNALWRRWGVFMSLLSPFDVVIWMTGWLAAV
ncbi:hypothetical protein ACNKHL_13270 [Shigella flexneri]